MPCWVGKYYRFTIKCYFGNYCGFTYDCIVTYYSIVLGETNMKVIMGLHITQLCDYYVPTQYTIAFGSDFSFIPKSTGTT
jgi:hypothetical protein